jgi:hypothetical protein
MSWFSLSEGRSTAGARSRLFLLAGLLSFALVGCPVDERALGQGSTGGGRAGSGLDAYAGLQGLAGSDGGSSQRADAGAAGHAEGGADGGGEAAGGAAGGGGDVSASGAGPDFGAGGCGDLDGNDVQDCDETLIDNASFDSDTSAWEVDTIAAQTWDARNARPAQQSGSISVSNAQALVGDGVIIGGAGQCRPTVGDARYVVAARTLIPGGQGQGGAGLLVFFYGAEDCADYSLGSLGPELVTTTDRWLAVEGTVKAPQGARSMRVKLVASKPFAQAKLQALFDDVLVREQ